MTEFHVLNKQALAEKLHELKPDLYKDPNHKPEMAVALTPFEALCGFREFSEICNFLKGKRMAKNYIRFSMIFDVIQDLFSEVPEFAFLLGPDNVTKMLNAINDVSNQKDALKDAFTSVMKTPIEVVKKQLSLLIERVLSMGVLVSLSMFVFAKYYMNFKVYINNFSFFC